jgi:hypothetical protein
MEAHEANLNPPNLKILQGYWDELEKINTRRFKDQCVIRLSTYADDHSPPNLVERRINEMENFIRRNDTNANVQAVLNGYKAGDPKFIDRDETLIMANGEIIGRTKDIEFMKEEEFDRLTAPAGPHPLWFEDVSTLTIGLHLEPSEHTFPRSSGGGSGSHRPPKTTSGTPQEHLF